MTILRLKPVAQARRRQLVMNGIRIWNGDEEVVDPGTPEGIFLMATSIYDVKGEVALADEDVLKPTGTYVVSTETVEIQNISGKDPLLLVDALPALAKKAKTLYCPQYVTKGWEAPISINFTPVSSMTAAELLGSEVARIIIIA